MTVGEWIGGRVPEVPPAFRPYLGSAEKPSVEGLTRAAGGALDQAVKGGARDRASAFALLAADAYLTYGCAVAVENGGGPEELDSVLRGLIRELP